MIQIRQAVPEDLEQIQQCIDNAFRPYIAQVGKKPAPMLEDYAAAIENAHLVVAEENRMIVGTLLLKPQSDYMLLDVIAVDPNCQSQGVGSRLLQYTEEYCRRQQISEIRLYTNIYFEKAQAVYAHKGYKEYQRITEDGYHRIYYRKAVD